MSTPDRELLRPLDHEPAGPSTVDIDRAVAVGRRRIRARRAAGVGMAATLTAFTLVGASLVTRAVDGAPEAPPGRAASSDPARPPAPPAPTSCRISLLPVPDGRTMALVTGADRTGRYLLGRSYADAASDDGSRQVLLWDNGQVRKIDMPGADQMLNDITTGGTAVGSTFEAAGEGPDNVHDYPYVYADGTLRRLRGVTSGSAYAINERGMIVGQDSSTNRPVMWRTPTSTATPLPVPEGTTSARALDIDEDGTIVGIVTTGGRDDLPYVWQPDGGHKPLPLPDIDGTRAAIGRAFSIDSGFVGGLAEVASPDHPIKTTKGSSPKAKAGGGPVAVRWDLRSGAIRLYPEFDIRLSDVNGHGWAIGHDKQGHPVFQADGRLVVLPAIGPPGPLTSIPNTISDDGRTIGGQSDDKDGVIRAVVWRCS